MAATVPELRSVIAQREGSYDVTGITKSVRSATWLDAARLQCWLAGRGSMDVPVHSPMALLDDVSSDFRYWIKPRYQTTRYAVTLVITGGQINVSGSTQVANITVSGTGITSTTRYVRPQPQHMAESVTIFVDRSAQDTTEFELTISVTPSEATTNFVESIGVESVPRATLTVDADDLGAERFDFWIRQPIASANIGTQILGRQSLVRDACRRTGLFQFSRGTDSPWAITSSTYVDLFDGPIGILGRYLYSGDTTRTARWRVLAKCSDGTTAGSVTVTNDDGPSTIGIPAGTTSWTWLPAAGSSTIAVDAEDNTAADGLRGGSHDDHTFQAKRTAGVGNVLVSSISILDAAD